MQFKKQTEKKPLWEKIFSVHHSFFKRFLFASLIALLEFGASYSLYRVTNNYISSVTIVAVALIALFSGFRLSFCFAVFLALVNDYFFIPPIGSALVDLHGLEHLFTITGLAIFISYLGSSLRSAFQETIHAKQEAESASTAMERVLALISHDIRNPLAVLKTSTQIILKTPDQHDRHQVILNRMLKTVDRADSMIQTLLDVSSIRKGKLISLTFETCDLNSQLEQVIEEMKLTIGDRIILSAKDSLLGDWGIDGIRRVLENLVNNAIKYGEPNTPIEIKISREYNQAVISVHNSGKGISVEDQNHLFDPFYRTPGAEVSSVRGWGLGLSLVKGVVDAHEGTIQVESNSTSGTLFTIKLPIRKVGI